MRSSLVRIAALVVPVVAGLCLSLMIAVALFVSATNADFFGRVTDKKTALSEGGPLSVTLIVHKLLPDENAAEVSVRVSMPYDAVPKELQGQKGCLTIAVEDRSNLDTPSRNMGVVMLDCVQNNMFGHGIASDISTESAVFRLDATQSVFGYPSDDISILPLIYVFASKGAAPQAQFNIEKAFPGRILAVDGKGHNWEVHFTRSPFERYFVIGSASLFIFIFFLVAVGLVLSRASLASTTEFVAVAGLTLSLASIRDALGFAKAPSVGTLEIATLGLPLIFLAAAIVMSFVRSILQSKWGTSADADAGRSSDLGDTA